MPVHAPTHGAPPLSHRLHGPFDIFNHSFMEPEQHRVHLTRSLFAPASKTYFPLVCQTRRLQVPVVTRATSVSGIHRPELSRACHGYIAHDVPFDGRRKAPWPCTKALAVANTIQSSIEPFESTVSPQRSHLPFP